MANEELWRKRVADWRASGLSAAEYCKGQEFTTGPLYRWSSRLAEAARGEASPAVPLVRLVRGTKPPAPAPAEAASRAAQVIIEVQGARVLVPPGADVATVGMVLEALGVAGRSGGR
ncbi:IS66 family insertion sequence element accessory protein TnpA [Pyxidicoccus sp. 3LG]